MNAALAWVVVVPLGAAVLTIAVASRAGRWVAAIAGPCTLVIAGAIACAVGRSGTLRHRVGGWQPPLGIELRADGLAAVMLLAVAVVGTIVTIHAAAARDRDATSRAFFPLWLFAWAALDALVLSADIFNLYVALELTTLAGVGLAASGRGRRGATAALRYLLFALPGSILYLLGIALLYGQYGALDLGVLARSIAPTPVITAAVALMVAGLCLKAALAPFHAWPLQAYASAPPPAGALLASVVSKGAYYVLLRLWIELIPPGVERRIGVVVGTLGAVAIVWGALQAMRQRRVTMVVAYSSVAHTGYLFVGVVTGTETAWAGSMYVAVSHAAAVAAMLVATGTITRAVGSDDTDALIGLAHRLPVTFAAMALAGLSLMGMPPSGGFTGKWLVLRATIETGRWGLSVVVLSGGLLAAGYTVRLLRGAFLPLPAAEDPRPVALGGQLAALALALVAVAIGIMPSPGLRLLGGST